MERFGQGGAQNKKCICSGQVWLRARQGWSVLVKVGPRTKSVCVGQVGLRARQGWSVLVGESELEFSELLNSGVCVCVCECVNGSVGRAGRAQSAPRLERFG